MDTDALITALARTITKREDKTNAEARRLLLNLALRFRALFATFPAEGQVLRTLRYNQLRPQILAALQDFVSTYYVTLRVFLPRLDTAIRIAIAESMALSTPLPAPTVPELLATASVLRRPAAALLTPSDTGIAPLTLQLERLLDTSITAAILRDAPTPEIVDLIAPRTTRVRKGTVLNAWLERLAATTASIYWSLVTPALADAATQRTAKLAAEPDTATPAPPTPVWRWNAVLDPKTCPRCRPLHNTTAPDPAAFPEGPPPLHPHCRCVVVPQFATP